MMVLYLKRLIFTLLSSLQVFSFTLPTTHSGLDYSPSSCVPFKSSFSPSDVSQSQRTPFTGISSKDSYGFSESGMELYLDKPHGTIKTKGGENDKVAEGATINSTFTLLYGKVNFEISAPEQAGVVTAAILIADERDEIDIELLGGDVSHWQTNVFAYGPKDKEPLWGVFGEIEDYPKKSTIISIHRYTIDWNEHRIIWSVDGVESRTLSKDDTLKDDNLHYPSHSSRIQLGIWDASNPAGTAKWAKGPIDWRKAPSRISATFSSVEIECPY